MERRIFVFWTGDNAINDNRKSSINQLKALSDCEVIMVTKDNLHEWIKEPLHESYQYLSAVHKSDYLRTYFMHFYGGGYSDIKKTRGTWLSAFDNLESSDAYASGYRESAPYDVAYHPAQSSYRNIIGNCSYICKPNTNFTKEWYDNMISLLDSKLDSLKLHPASHPYDKAEDKDSSYPIEWNEMLGRIFHRLVYENMSKFNYDVPTPVITNYR